MTLNNTLYPLIYMLLFGATVVGLLWWQKRQRKTRLPFGEETKLCRQPGETLLNQVRKSDEEEPIHLLWASCVPALLGLSVLILAARLPKALVLPGAAVAVLVFLVTYWLAARWMARRAQENGNRHLGYFGERIVAEHLEPLKRAGWYIFHDVPGQSNGTKFNVDHVAVGPQGVFAIETKTRRKGNARPGFDDHKVYFDGQVLIWPWGEDNHGLEQAERNALWLAETIRADLGERFHVSPVLTLPGWWVEQKPSRQARLARVTNPKGLAKFLPSGSAVLSDKQIAAIAAKLDARCRDVQF